MSAPAPSAAPAVLREDCARGVLVLRLSNPARRNALTDAMLAGLVAELEALAGDPACRVLVLEGAGEDFCAGRDMADIQGATDRDPHAAFDALPALARTLRDFPKPVVAVVRGYCLGLGAAVAALADLAVAADTARIGFPEVKVGIAPSFTTVALLANVGAKAAADLLLTGRMIAGTEAERIGLVTRAVPPGELAETARQSIDALVRASTTAQMAAKRLMRPCRESSFDEALAHALQTTLASTASADAREGIAAFRDKREPRWSAPH